MINLLEDVHKALDSGAVYLALMGALALPDICASLEHADGRASGERYIAWFDRWVGYKYEAFLSCAQCYSFRCTMLHQGATGLPDRDYKRIVFLLPGATPNFPPNLSFDPPIREPTVPRSRLSLAAIDCSSSYHRAGGDAPRGICALLSMSANADRSRSNRSAVRRAICRTASR